jgi:hypothetical protein
VIAEVARQPKSRTLVAVVHRSAVRHERDRRQELVPGSRRAPRNPRKARLVGAPRRCPSGGGCRSGKTLGQRKRRVGASAETCSWPSAELPAAPILSAAEPRMPKVVL